MNGLYQLLIPIIKWLTDYALPPFIAAVMVILFWSFIRWWLI
jgi:hypothetical protein